MTSCAPEAAPAGTDPEQPLRQLISAGYRFVHPRDAAGEVVTVVGIRAHDNLVDVVCIDGADEVTATRMSGDESNVLAPDNALWRQIGRVDEVVGRLLALADDDYAAARAEPVKGCWVAAGEGRSAFLLAS